MKQHSALASILLHLLPGIPIVAGMFLFSKPAFTHFFGLNENLGPLLGFLMSLAVFLIPIQLGILLIASKMETGKFNIRAVINYTEHSSLKKYLIFVPILIVYSLILFAVVAPMIQPFFMKFFSWWPSEFNFQNLMQDPTVLAGYAGIKILLLVYILLSCLIGPFVEELYFRAYLLPRMKNYSGNWAPLLNSVLFSLYHFFSPWENLIRILAITPMTYVVWKNRNIRFGIIIHLFLNTMGGIVMLIMILKN
ncbi:lysostaphin resistance A-like protein [Bacteroidota bacterium]